MPRWSTRQRSQTRRVLPLPTYPFQRRRYWAEAVAATALPGVRHSSASGEVTWSQRLSLEAQPYLAHHRVFDTVLAPGALYVVVALAAGEARHLRNLLLAEPLVLEEHGRRELQLVFAPRKDGVAQSFEIFSSAGSGEPWTLHARGALDYPEAEETAEAVNLAEWRHLLYRMDVDDLYEAFADRGISFGPAFRCLDSVWSGPEEEDIRLSHWAAGSKYSRRLLYGRRCHPPPIHC